MRKAAATVLSLAGASARVRAGLYIPHRGMAMLAATSAVKTVDTMAVSHPHSDALKMNTDGAGPIKMTNLQLKRQIDAFANGILETPFNGQPTFVIWAKDCAETFVAQLGAAKAGLKVIVLDASAKEEDLVKALDTGARWLMISPSLLPQLEVMNIVYKHFPECHTTINRVLRNARFPALRFILSTGFDRQEGMVKFSAVLAYVPEPSPLNELRPALGTITYQGTNKVPEVSVPYMDPAVKLSEKKVAHSDLD